jgi:hypothetical protein
MELLVAAGYTPNDADRRYLKPPAAGEGDDYDYEEVEAAAERSCRVCFCTDDEACEGGCRWVRDPEGLGDLCSACLPKVLEAVNAQQAAALAGS